MATVLKEDYGVEKEPPIEGTNGSCKADLKLTPKRHVADRRIIISDLHIVESESHTANDIYITTIDTDEDLIPSREFTGARETMSLLSEGFALKQGFYARKGVLGVTPWVLTTLGVVHGVFERWLDTLAGGIRCAVTAALAKSLLRARALAAAQSIFQT